MAYKHGPYGEQQAVGEPVATKSQIGMVVFGTAPVHTIEGGAANVNVPVVVNSIAEARAKFGYSDDWASYTLCEAMHYILEMRGVGPLILINMFNPAVHKAAEKASKSLTPSNSQVIITNAGSAVLDSVLVKSGNTTKVKGTDYEISYNWQKETITITELTSGALGSTALTITYDVADPSAVTEANIIGSTDDMGLNTGIYAIKNVYALTGYIPAFMLAPGFSQIPAIHAAMYGVSRKLNSHWDVWMYTDIPISYTVGETTTAVTLANAHTWKKANGYNKANETTNFPMAAGTDGNKYHLSVLRAGAMLELLTEYDGIPWHSASNTDASIIENLWMGADNTGRIYDDDVINRYLNKNGIASAAFAGGHWVLWGAEAAQYDQDDGNDVNRAETNLLMLFYVTNDFQHRRFGDTDEPKTANDIKQLVGEEQSLLDGLVSAKALTYARAYIDASAISKSDMYNGGYKFTFDLTPTPLVRSMTALANYVRDGYEVYFDLAEESA